MGRRNIIAKEMDKCIEAANDRLGKKTDDNFEYCVLNDIGLGTLSQEMWDNKEIKIEEPKTERHEPSLLIKVPDENPDKWSYEDPDLVSCELYYLLAKKFNKKLEENENFKKLDLEPFKVARTRYRYCLLAGYNKNDKIIEIRLGADWVINWGLINKCPADEQWSIIETTHTIKGHVLWPCVQKIQKIERKKKRRQTVNQARKHNISIYETLNKLKESYDNKFKKQTSALERAFYDYKDWYKSFGSFDNYIDFWELDRFTEKEITPCNIKYFFKQQKNDLKAQNPDDCSLHNISEIAYVMEAF